MRKVILLLIPITTLTLFILIMLGGLYLKKPVSDSDDVLKYINLLQEDITNENWESAVENREKIQLAWEKVIPRIQYSVDRDEMLSFERILSRLKGSLSAKNKSGGLVELSELQEYWDELGK